jgi:hypothetical protein
MHRTIAASVTHRKKIGMIALVLGIIAAGTWWTWWTIHQSELEMHQNLLDQANLIAQAIEPVRVQRLSGSSSDDTGDVRKSCKKESGVRYNTVYLPNRSPGLQGPHAKQRIPHWGAALPSGVSSPQGHRETVTPQHKAPSAASWPTTFARLGHLCDNRCT